MYFYMDAADARNTFATMCESPVAELLLAGNKWIVIVDSTQDMDTVTSAVRARRAREWTCSSVVHICRSAYGVRSSAKPAPQNLFGLIGLIAVRTVATILEEVGGDVHSRRRQ
jgi:hypothetical protein